MGRVLTTDPLFSIVTISYNQAEFLARTIESVLSQEGVRIQYIVCDPGSTDGSREIIDSYGDRISKRVYDRDDGPSDGLNRGFAHATGDIYAYLNSDDTFLPGALARVARHFRAHPDADVLTGHGLITDRDDRIVRRVWSAPYRPRNVAYMAAEQFQSSTFFRAAAFKNTRGFNSQNRSCWDSELLVDLFLSGARFTVIDEFLGTFRLHPASITMLGPESADIEHFLRERFFRLIGRERRRYDMMGTLILKLWKGLRYPNTAMELLRFGSVQAYRRKLVGK